MAYWLIKSDPEERSFTDLADDGWKGSEWSGVREDEAFDTFAAMQPNDLAFFYHTGEENRFYGIIRILSTAHADSTDDSGQWLSVEVAVFLRLICQITVQQVKNDEHLAAFSNEVESGPSVQSVAYDDWEAICKLAGMPKIPKSG